MAAQISPLTQSCDKHTHMKRRYGGVRRDATCTTARHDAPWQHHWARGHRSGFEHKMRVSRSTAIGTEDGEHELRDTS